MISKHKFIILKYINTNEHVKKKTKISILVSKTTNEMHNKLSPLNEHNNNPIFCEIIFQIFKKLLMWD
jgi:hypothetical protein